MLRRNLILSLFCFGLINLQAQTKKAFIEAIDEAVEKSDYYSAMVYSYDALEFDTTDIDMQYTFAQNARHFDAYIQAAKAYEYVLNNDADLKYPDAQYWLATMNKRIGNYDLATTQFQTYLSENEGDDAYMTAIANKELAVSEWAVSMTEDPRQNVVVENLGGSINTPYSEFGAVQFDESLYYSSLRYETEVGENKDKRLYSKLLTAEKDILNGIEVNTDLNADVNNVAHTTFNMNNTRVYFTLCDYVSASEIRCDLYYAPINEDGSYGSANKLPDNINGANFTSTQPNIGYDKNLGREILYFVSDREGGKGKLDIWSTTIESGSSFSDPVNLSSINTAENDITPFYHKETNTIYFSSEGYQSLGGYDIYRTGQLEDGTFSEVLNLELPINSSYHDVYYSLSPDGEEGYLSSNRLGSQYIDGMREACCYDIYKADITPLEIQLNALTFNEITQDSLNGVTVQVIELLTGDVVGEITNPTSIDHLFDIKSDKEYQVIASKFGYSSDTINFSSWNANPDDVIIKKLFLEPQMIELEVLTFDALTKEDLTGVTVVLEDLTDPSQQVVIELNELSNGFNFLVERGKKYRITANKDGYDIATTILDTTDPSLPAKITEELYLGLPNLNAFLPITLYFDNDHPDPRSYKLYTLLNYTDTYIPYYGKKDEFITKYTNQISQELKYSAAQDLENFFEVKVRGGYNNFHQFLDKLLIGLRYGQSYEIEIKGFASPKATNKYNLALGQRRVYSIQNELRDHQSGSFEYFLNTGKLKLTDVSFGEELAPEGISDSHSDRRNSVYSVEASEERKAQIVRVKKLN